MPRLVRIQIYGLDRSWRWRMTSANGKILGASSEDFTSRAKAVRNLWLVSGIDAGCIAPRRGPINDKFPGRS